jgi:hypothetical protein
MTFAPTDEPEKVSKRVGPGYGEGQAGGKKGGGVNSGSFYEALAKAWGEALDKP